MCPDDTAWLLDAEFREILDGSCENRFVATNHNWSLDEFRMLGHHAGQLIITQILARNELPVGVFVGSQCVPRPQSGKLQQAL